MIEGIQQYPAEEQGIENQRDTYNTYDTHSTHETRDSTEIIRNSWRLTYSNEFNNIREAHPHIISRIAHMIEELDHTDEKDFSHNTAIDGDISLSLLSRKHTKSHYSLELPEGHFFLKEVQLGGTQIEEGGFEEYQYAMSAKQALADIPGVSVVEYQFGFSNREKNYVVTKWNTHVEKPLIRTLDEITRESTDDHGHHIPTLSSDKVQSITDRIARIQHALVDFRDVGPTNMGYDPVSDTVIVFDINKGNSSLIESSNEDF